MDTHRIVQMLVGFESSFLCASQSIMLHVYALVCGSCEPAGCGSACKLRMFVVRMIGEHVLWSWRLSKG